MRSILILLPFLLLAACRGSEQNASGLNIPSTDLEAADSIRLMDSIIRYVGDLPDKASFDNRSDTAWDAHYAKELLRYRLDRYHRDSLTGDEFLLVSRPAPSIAVKRVSFGIRLHRDQGRITRYLEAFRTWKMPEEVLLPRADSLFAFLVAGQDLSPWYSDKKGDAYIEFPDAETQYDTLARRWVSTREDPVGAMKAEYEKR